MTLPTLTEVAFSQTGEGQIVLRAWVIWIKLEGMAIVTLHLRASAEREQGVRKIGVGRCVIWLQAKSRTVAVFRFCETSLLQKCIAKTVMVLRRVLLRIEERTKAFFCTAVVAKVQQSVSEVMSSS